MEEPEFSCTILFKLNLDDTEKVVDEAYHKENALADRRESRWASSNP